jgi:hypothetical protein
MLGMGECSLNVQKITEFGGRIQKYCWNLREVK